MKSSDWALVRQIKDQVNKLPDLEIPPEGAYIILETDGSMMGRVGVCKWKPSKYDPRSMEKVCAYAHGKFPVVKLVIDAEIFAAMETMSDLKIHFLDKREITMRTDCLVEGREVVAVLTDAAEEASTSTRFPLLAEYEDLIHAMLPKILLKEEHNKRHRMAKIEDEAIINVLEKLLRESRKDLWNDVQRIQQIGQEIRRVPREAVVGPFFPKKPKYT
ncbi:hypothetical protein ZIOFF_045071 [Zingiber officinale]|uniref:Reverse transcriptase/retrotransposon-derived protein RNase H-like domain-containing protein n=1 Tax=Zingiber officinale TaxID=94328 RepID=A0A8J5G2B9_ZINOF|nr:hypothetical protein ZIOFF_045071 [Zingiber officinale]